MARELGVYLRGTRAGTLTQTDSGRLEFRYRSDWPGPALSLSLPLGGEIFEHRAAEPFFGGLLPEEGVRERIARYLGVTARNDFALLAEIGGECAGAVSLHAGAPAADAVEQGAAAGPRVLTGDELETLLDELPRRPLLVGGEARLSLAGAQDKVAVALHGASIALPTGDAPTTHILKTPIAGLVGTVWNELVCLRTAEALGLPVAQAERREHRGTEFLLVERYDRTTFEGAPARLHQEDFCQALGVPTRTKYQSEGGPGLDALFTLLTEHATRPALDRIALLRATLFNVLVGNADAHGKNFGLLHGNEPVGRSGVQLAPLYDILSTLAYPDLSRRYAMKIGRAREFADIKPEDWGLFAERAGLSPAQVKRELGALAAKLPRVLSGVVHRDAADADQGAKDLLAAVVDETTVRCEIAQRHVKGSAARARRRG